VPILGKLFLYGYVIIGGAAVVVMWNPAYPGVRVIFAVTVAWVSVVSLVPLLFLLYRTVPGLANPLPDADPEPGPVAVKND
jgi:hypothetical protein